MVAGKARDDGAAPVARGNSAVVVRRCEEFGDLRGVEGDVRGILSGCGDVTTGRKRTDR